MVKKGIGSGALLGALLALAWLRIALGQDVMPQSGPFQSGAAVHDRPSPALQGGPSDAEIPAQPVQTMHDGTPAVGGGASAMEEVALPGITAQAYIVIDGDSGETLLQYHASEGRPMASLTKIMTALLVLERGNLDDIATVPEAVSNLRFSTLMGVRPGEQVSVRDLLYGMMLPSGNDAAIALAYYISGDEETFTREMNRRALELGLRNTRFANSHGLDSRTEPHFASAVDLAALTQYAMQIPDFRTVAAARSWFGRGVQRNYSMVNINGLLAYYPGANGVKIGYTRRAGQTIVGSAVRKGRWLIAVALGSKQSVTDARMLLDNGFELAAQ